MEVITVDARTIMIKSDNENDLAEVIQFIEQKKKNDEVDKLVQSMTKNKASDKAPVFNRNGYYDRSWLPD